MASCPYIPAGTSFEGVKQKQKSFDYMKGKDFLESYARQKNVHHWEISFFVEGIHCLACLWLIEKIPSLVQGVLSVHLDLGKAIALVEVNGPEKIYDVALQSLSVYAGLSGHLMKYFDFLVLLMSLPIFKLKT